MAFHLIFLTIFTKMKVDSYGCLSIEETLTLHNDTTIIKSILNKDKKYYF